MAVDAEAEVAALPLAGYALHHVAIVVADLDAAVARYVALGFGPGEREEVAAQAVKVATFRLGAGFLELIEPADPDGPIARFLHKRGEGLHHVAYRVTDLAAALERLRERGVRLIDEAPRTGVHGWRIAFVHPESCAGVLTELVEVPAAKSWRKRPCSTPSS